MKTPCPSTNRGFTLLEVLFVVAILSTVLVNMIRLFLDCSVLAEASGNITLATAAAQTKLEEIRDHDFSAIAVDYGASGTPGPTFTTGNPPGRGFVAVDAADPDLLVLAVSVCWRNKDGRIVGEDANLNGVLDSGEDLDGDAQVDSPVVLMTYVANR